MFKIHDGLYEARFGTINKTEKLAGFDMDWTLIKTKSGKTFAQSAHDWQFLYECTAEKLRKLNEDSYQVVVFTN